MSDRELKPISFNPKANKVDKEILDYIEELGVSFGSYVKFLIRKDMKASTSETSETSEIASQLKELVSIFKTGNISIGNIGVNETNIETAVTIEEPEETEEERKQRLAMESFLNMGGK